MPQLTIDQAMQIAVQHHQAGRLQQAEQIYRQILAQVPGYAEAHSNLGLALKEMGRLDEAFVAYRRAIALGPNNAAAHYNLGLALWATGQSVDAIAAYRRAIVLSPDYIEAYSNLGIALADAGQLDEAIAAYGEAIALNPNYVEAYSNVAVALVDKGQFDEAITACRRAITLRPNYPQAHNNLGNALVAKGQLDEAIPAYRLAIALRPDYAEAHNNLGNALKNQWKLNEAIAACRQAIALRPNYAEAYYNLGNALALEGQLDDAIAADCQAIALRPDYAEAHSNLILTLHYHAGYDSQRIAQEERRWNERHAQPLAELIHPHTNTPTPDRRLRIGYMSRDFKTHSMSRFLLPVIEHHDPAHVEVFCYADVRRPDETTSRFRERAHAWRSIAGLADEAVAELVRQDAIDVLVDLAMHTAHNRLLVFARKPAPVQVSWLAYPGSTGMDAIDYRLTDRFLDPFDSTQGQVPPGVDDAFHAEQSVRLPDCWCCYRPREETPLVNDLPAITAGQVTFGCLNNFCKVSREALTGWCRLLREISRSCLLLHANEGIQRQHLRDLLVSEGLDPNRIVFVGRVPVQEYLRLYHQIDVGLDPFPYSGGTTSCDALWMGVPVVSLSGRTAAGRGTATLLHNIGLPELVADSQESYIETAKKLALGLSRLSQMRSGLRQRMQSSPLMDEPRFTRNVEAAYREMWRRWCEGREQVKDV